MDEVGSLVPVLIITAENRTRRLSEEHYKSEPAVG
jgi:hypothetical protein